MPESAEKEQTSFEEDIEKLFDEWTLGDIAFVSLGARRTPEENRARKIKKDVAYIKLIDRVSDELVAASNAEQAKEVMHKAAHIIQSHKLYWPAGIVASGEWVVGTERDALYSALDKSKQVIKTIYARRSSIISKILMPNRKMMSKN